MEYTSLSDLIWSIEYGTNLHFCVVFLDNYGNYKTQLSKKQKIHSKEYCEFMKNQKKTLQQCVECRNTSLKRAINEKISFGGLCCNGIYEYCQPVIKDGNVVAVIFLGNILHDADSIKNETILDFVKTFEVGFSEENCKRLCAILENQIKLLIDEFSDFKSDVPVLVGNIKSCLEDVIFSSNVSVSDLALMFNYNEKYIGKLFKKYEGKTIKEYVNYKRLKKAEKLLAGSNYNVTEISAMVGFNNMTYFSKMFRKAYGVSPIEYRKKHIQQSFAKTEKAVV